MAHFYTIQCYTSDSAMSHGSIFHMGVSYPARYSPYLNTSAAGVN